jgi:hypothetical protein
VPVLPEYRFEDRALEKRESREADARALASGQKSKDDLRRENGAFAFPNVELDLKASDRLW